jgi:hypothetical protein
MASFQCHKLLAKRQVFEKQPATTVEELEDHTRQEYKRVNHVRVLSRFACELQCHILLKSQADRILTRDRGREFESPQPRHSFPGIRFCRQSRGPEPPCRLDLGYEM